MSPDAVTFIRRHYADLDVAVFGCGDGSDAGWIQHAAVSLGSRPQPMQAVTDVCLNVLDANAQPIPLNVRGVESEYLGVALRHIEPVARNGLALLPEETTLAEILARQGYQTAGFVSSFLVSHRFGFEQGFEHFDDRLPAEQASLCAPLVRGRGRGRLHDDRSDQGLFASHPTGRSPKNADAEAGFAFRLRFTCEVSDVGTSLLYHRGEPSSHWGAGDLLNRRTDRIKDP